MPGVQRPRRALPHRHRRRATVLFQRPPPGRQHLVLRQVRHAQPHRAASARQRRYAAHAPVHRCRLGRAVRRGRGGSVAVRAGACVEADLDLRAGRAGWPNAVMWPRAYVPKIDPCQWCFDTRVFDSSSTRTKAILASPSMSMCEPAAAKRSSGSGRRYVSRPTPGSTPRHCAN